MEQYNVLETNRPAVDRNKRGRDDYQTGGGSVSINGGTQTEGSAAEEGHHHDNLTTLNKLSDSEGYLKLKAASVAEATGEVTVTDEKVKAGYADRAHDLDEDSPANDRFLNRKKEDEALERIRFRKGLEAEGASTFHGGLLVRSPLGARQLKTAISSALIEEGDPCVMNLSLIEEGDGNTETLSTSLSEVPAASGATTLGELDNVDPAFDTVPDGSYILSKKNGIYCPEKFSPLNLKLFTEVAVNKAGAIVIDCKQTPYAKVVLSGDNKILALAINNTENGMDGQILVCQTGYKQISLAGNIKGTIDLPLTANTIALLSYNCVDGIIYMHSSMVLGDIQFPAPQRISDLILVYSDASVCTVQWTAPRANNIYDKATEYDMRYSNSLADAGDPKVWSGLKAVKGVPEPSVPGGVQKMTISGLAPNKEYYVYLKSVKVNYGVEYISEASDFVYFKTLGSEDTSKAYRINLDQRNLIPQLRNYLTAADGSFCSVEKMVDEMESNVFLPDGYPDTKNKDYTTFWSAYKYGRDTSPYNVYIDLFSVYAIDKMFVYSRSKPKFSVYGMNDMGYPWEKMGDIPDMQNEWKSIDFRSFKCRFIKISFDLMDFGAASTDPPMPVGSEDFPDPEYNGTLERIDNVLLYGRAVSNRPDGIMPPLRRSTARKTVDQFFCTNGHAYQQGRIHSMCSGERMRMYIHFGHFNVHYGTPDSYKRLADMRFKVSQIPWISGNNGTGDDFEDMLRKSYKRFGLKPYLCNTGVFDYCYYDRSKTVHNRPCDGYWYPSAWRPAPKRGVGGLDKYFGVTNNPLSYKTYARLCQALAAKYGNRQTDGSRLYYPLDEPETTGLDLVSGIEPENEPDQNWSGWIGYAHAEEYAAVLSAASDGHNGMISDEDGRPANGIKEGGILAVSSGTASVNRAYYLSALMQWKSLRSNASIPVDVLSMHMYFSNIGSQESSKDPVQYGITFEQAMLNSTGGELPKMIEMRNRIAPSTEIALTEFGWGESGVRNGKCKYQCYTQPGQQIGGWVVPDRHRSDVKGAWIVRACIQMMALGVDFVNYYSTECESDYFGAGNWDSGAGFEMFHWSDCKDAAPGAKAEAIKKFEHGYDRGGFATTGLFGQILSNGAYPVTRAYWWVATMRNRLKGYVYTGMKYIAADERIVVACFRKQGEEKGAYAVYLNDSRNTGVAGIAVPVPEGVARVQHVTVYVPDIANPQDVPGNLGYDQRRTGMAASRKERFEKGVWVLANEPYMPGKYMSYTQAPAVYPLNPSEGDEVTVLPTLIENPYFPIVGPVNAKSSSHGNKLSAQNYEQDREEWETAPNTDKDGNVIWTVKRNAALAWRQVDAVCDYIDYHPEGVRGKTGDAVTQEVMRGCIQTNVSEFPEYYFFDAVPDPDYRSEVTGFNSSTISGSSVELWWNNTNTEDTGYQIFVSSLPETGYTLLKEIPVGVDNKAVLAGLSPDTTYYYKIRPVKGKKEGALSAYTSAKTFSELPVPANLRISSRTVESISLSWDYTPDQISDFAFYSVYRADETGSFVQAGRVDDKSLHTYTDNNLAAGHAYRYKLRAVGLNGMSACTPELAARTLLAEECSPSLKTSVTDKLGIKIILTFDLPIGAVDSGAKTRFTITEDGNLRMINYVARDEINHNNLNICIPQDSLKDYDKKSDIRISYSGGGIKSEYGVVLEGFSGVKVANLIGNFTNIEAVYKLNFTSTAALPAGGEWNDIAGSPESDKIEVLLKDSYGRESTAMVSAIQNKPAYAWGGNVEAGYCEIAGIDGLVYKNAWVGPAFGANVSENMVARLRFSGLNNEHRYSFRHFGATSYGTDRNVKIKIDGVYSSVMNQKGNKSSYLTIEDCKPSAGIIYVDVINATEGANTNYPVTAFMMVEEFRSSSEPENKNVFLREASVSEAVDGVVKFADIKIHLNCIGTVTAYRTSEVQEMAAMPWTDIVNNNLDVPFTLSAGFGQKTLYVQVKNLYSESNIRTIHVEYKDPYVPLVLRNVYINDNNARTYAREVEVMLDKEGIPTHYKIAETADLSAVAWMAWADPAASKISFTLSAASGQKTVYVQIMDVSTLCAVKSDTINYMPIERKNIELALVLPAGVDAAAVRASFPILKYRKKFIFTYTADDGPVGAYGKVFRAVNKKWVDDEKFFHLGQDATTGYTPEKTLGYTDGCGVEHRIPVGVAIWPNCGNANNPQFMDKDKEGKYYPYIIWPELKPILDFGGEIYFHNMNQDKWDKNDPIKIAEGLKEDQSKTVIKLGRGMKVMMRPDGNNNYVTAATMLDDIVMSFAENTPAAYLYPDDDPPLHKSVGLRKMYTDDNVSEMAWVKGVHDSPNPVWAHLFTHTPMQAIVDFLTSVNGVYGKDGDDTAWFATVDEVYEYWFVRKNAVINKEVTGQTVKFTISVPIDQHFYHKDICLDIEGVSSLTGVEVQAGNAALGYSYGIKANKLMVNINYDEQTVDRAQKYTAAFESSVTVEDKDDALYFLSHLRDTVAAPYLARINAVSAPPVLLDFAVLKTIPDGTNTVDVTFTYSTNERATHYMVSESAGFIGAEWKPVNGPNEQFILSNVSGLHTLYLKTKNKFGESTVLSASINYVPEAFGLAKIKLNNGTVVATDATIQVSFSAKGIDAPTHYMVSESAGFIGAEWKPYANPAAFVLSDGSGLKTVYAKIKNANSISEAVSSTITLNIVVKKVAYSVLVADSNGLQIMQTKDGAVNRVRIVNNTEVKLKYNDGTDSTIFFYNDSTIAGSTGIQSANNNPVSPATYEGVYNYDVVKACAFYNEYNQPATIVPHRIIFKAPAGNYKVRILGSTSNSNGASTANKYYECNGIQKQPSFSLVNNFTNFVELDNVQPDVQGYLVVKWWGNPTRGAMCCTNLIEIIKK